MPSFPSKPTYRVPSTRSMVLICVRLNSCEVQSREPEAISYASTLTLMLLGSLRPTLAPAASIVVITVRYSFPSCTTGGANRWGTSARNAIPPSLPVVVCRSASPVVRSNTSSRLKLQSTMLSLTRMSATQGERWNPPACFSLKALLYLVFQRIFPSARSM